MHACSVAHLNQAQPSLIGLRQAGHKHNSCCWPPCAHARGHAAVLLPPRHKVPHTHACVPRFCGIWPAAHRAKDCGLGRHRCTEREHARRWRGAERARHGSGWRTCLLLLNHPARRPRWLRPPPENLASDEGIHLRLFSVVQNKEFDGRATTVHATINTTRAAHTDFASCRAQQR